MNIQQAISIPLKDLLDRMGCEVKGRSNGGKELRYLSPWRAESEPSLYYNIVIYKWHDHG